MSNPKKPQQPAGREPIPADAFDLPPSGRERVTRRAPSQRSNPDMPTKTPPAVALQSRPVPSLPPPLPPLPADLELQPPAQAPQKIAPHYAGSVINEARRRQETGQIGLPQPLPTAPSNIPPKKVLGPFERPTLVDRVAPAAVSQPTTTARIAAAPSVATPRTERTRRRWVEPLPEFVYIPQQMPPYQKLILCIALSALAIWALFATPLGLSLGTYSGTPSWSDWATQTINPAAAKKLNIKPMQHPLNAVGGENSIVGPPSLTASEIDQILSSYNSPAAGSGRDFYNLGLQYGIDPAYALAFFIHESSAGTNTGWAGLKPDGNSTHNIGNIICAGYPACYNRFRDYGSWAEGIDDWYKLIATEYIANRSAYTVEQIIPIYAPSSENNVPGYINEVNRLVLSWRQGNR